MKKDSIKNRRINDEVMRSLSDIIRNEMKDPRVSPFTSILQVEVAPDLKTCKVWFTVLGSPETANGRSKACAVRTALSAAPLRAMSICAIRRS